MYIGVPTTDLARLSLATTSLLACTQHVEIHVAAICSSRPFFGMPMVRHQAKILLTARWYNWVHLDIWRSSEYFSATRCMVLLHSRQVLAYEVLHIQFKPNHGMQRVAVLSFYKDVGLLDKALLQDLQSDYWYMVASMPAVGYGCRIELIDVTLRLGRSTNYIST